MLCEPLGASLWVPRRPVAPPEKPDASAFPLTPIEACDEGIRRATINLAEHSNLSLLSIALDHLTLSRASLYRTILQNDSNPLTSCLVGDEKATESAASSVGSQDAITKQPPDHMRASTELDLALTGLRDAERSDHLPKALLTAAMLHSQQGLSGMEKSLAHLAEAEQIATRGPMPLYLADIHLTRARIVGRLNIGAKQELAEARRLIEKHGYWRRREELEDAEMAILHPEQFPAYLERIHREEEETRLQQDQRAAEEKAKREALEAERLREVNRKERQADKKAKQKKKDAKKKKKKNR